LHDIILGKRAGSYLVIKEFIETNKGKRIFLEHEVKMLLQNMGLTVPHGIFIRKDEPISAHGLNYPLVVKVSSTAIASKSDVHGIRSGINSANDLKKSVEDLRQIENAEGVLIEETAPAGVEVIVGGVTDKQFGPIVMFGLGGIFVELFKDIAFGLAPMTEGEAQRLIRQVKGYRLLEEYRGRPPIDIQALLRVILAVADIMSSGLVSEIDLNPVTLYATGAVVLDAKISL
jgi:acetate---CoA ligase (ADP-forming) subunit beta